MKRVRKAVVAGVLAAGGAAVTSLVAEIPQTSEGWAALISGAIGVGIVTGIATYNAKNAGTVNGSDPRTVHDGRM